MWEGCDKARRLGARGGDVPSSGTSRKARLLGLAKPASGPQNVAPSSRCFTSVKYHVPMVRGVRYGDLGDFLRAQNQQLTERRRTIWAIMCSEGGQLTAGQITEKARRRDPDIDQATVERALNLFADMGSAHQTPAGQEREPRWEIVNRGEHFRLTCELCGDIRHHAGVLAEKVRDHLDQRYAFSAIRMDLQVFGVCRRCSSGPES